LTLVLTCITHHTNNLFNLNNALINKLKFHSNTTTMNSNMSEITPLRMLYSQIEHGETLSAVLGVSSTATDAEIRDAYRVLILRIHPDKAPDDGLCKLHTRFFQKVQHLYDVKPASRPVKSTDRKPDVSKQLPETLVSLHSRNIDAKEALKQERSRVTDAKHVADARKAAKTAELKAKDEKLAGTRASRLQIQEAQRQKREKEIVTDVASEPEPKKIRSDGLAKSTAAATESEGRLRSSEFQDWEQEEDRLEAEDLARKERQKTKKQTTGRAVWERGVDEPIASDKDIGNRWDTDLLKGGTSGCVSLREREKRAHNVAAMAHQALMASIKVADDLFYPNCNARLSNPNADLFQDAVEDALMKQEAGIDTGVEEALGLMDQDVIEQHLLEDGKLERSASIGSLAMQLK
jgi:curved DNA-binding protein CbpA